MVDRALRTSRCIAARAAHPKWFLRTQERELNILIVRIYVNLEHIGTETAVRIKGGTDPNDLNTYRLSDGTVIRHKYGDGAAKLAEKMMKHLSQRTGL